MKCIMVLDHLIHREDNRGNNDGSDQHDNCALDQLAFRLSSLIPKFGIRLLDICK